MCWCSSSNGRVPPAVVPRGRPTSCRLCVVTPSTPSSPRRPTPIRTHPARRKSSATGNLAARPAIGPSEIDRHRRAGTKAPTRTASTDGTHHPSLLPRRFHLRFLRDVRLPHPPLTGYAVRTGTL
uniref:(northern house mosquito) hypothetical protein n=1 Tax=Culex pipiens TaxID=7175 RepID=A0A8D8BPT6_CULPI